MIQVSGKDAVHTKASQEDSFGSLKQTHIEMNEDLPSLAESFARLAEMFNRCDSQLKRWEMAGDTDLPVELLAPSRECKIIFAMLKRLGDVTIPPSWMDELTSS